MSGPLLQPVITVTRVNACVEASSLLLSVQFKETRLLDENKRNSEKRRRVTDKSCEGIPFHWKKVTQYNNRNNMPIGRTSKDIHLTLITYRENRVR